MNNPSGRLVIYLVAMASIFVILFGIRGSAYIINPILLAAVITITVLPIPSRLTKRGMLGWLALVLSILMVVVLLCLVIATVFFSITKLTTELPTYMASASQQASADISEPPDSTTSIQIQQVTTSLGSISMSLLASVTNLLVQFGLALAIFFFMISAALAFLQERNPSAMYGAVKNFLSGPFRNPDLEAAWNVLGAAKQKTGIPIGDVVIGGATGGLAHALNPGNIGKDLSGKPTIVDTLPVIPGLGHAGMGQQLQGVRHALGLTKSEIPSFGAATIAREVAQPQFHVPLYLQEVLSVDSWL